ncbi:MAG: metallophosphoesterase family protein [Candidatus Helarchaeota archaeon]
MRILAFSDFHGLFGFKNHFIDVKQKLGLYKPDILLLCGDLQDRGSMKLIENRLENLEFSPILFVWGNSEEQLNVGYGLKNAINIHLKIKKINNIHFAGLGGDEYDVKRDIALIRKMIAEKYSEIERLIIISHVPPLNTVDLCNDGRNVGVKEYRNLILEFKPILVVCGHIHEEAQKMVQIGSTMVYNIGPKGVLFNIEKKSVTATNLK